MSAVLRTRMIVGTGLALAATGVLFGDRYLSPWFPCLYVCLAVAGLVAGSELVRLYPPVFKPSLPLTLAGILLLVTANWCPLFGCGLNALEATEAVLVVVAAGAFLLELYSYREPGAAVPRLALAIFSVVYLGLFGSYLARLRWLDADVDRSTLMLALAIFVPKGGDIGAFFAGTFLGRHKMTPRLSPKKTWEGFAGGMLAAAAIAIGLSQAAPVFAYGAVEAALFGLVMGLVGVIGDLAESLVKRDCLTKDAAQSIPGFGGVLDVVDSVLFAAPVAYYWFAFTRPNP